MGILQESVDAFIPSMYIEGFNSKSHILYPDGTFRCISHCGTWQGKIIWTGIAPYYYQLVYSDPLDLKPKPVKVLFK